MHERNNLIISLYLIDKNAVRTLLSFELSGIYRGTTVQRDPMSDSIGDGLEFVK